MTPIGRIGEDDAAEAASRTDERRDLVPRARLDQIINLKHELVQLVGKIDRAWIDEQIAIALQRQRAGQASRAAS